MWTDYFRFIKLRRGRVITPSHGEIDFSRDDISVETCKDLFDQRFPYLELTEVGKKELYGIITVCPKITKQSGVVKEVTFAHHVKIVEARPTSKKEKSK